MDNTKSTIEALKQDPIVKELVRCIEHMLAANIAFPAADEKRYRNAIKGLSEFRDTNSIDVVDESINEMTNPIDKNLTGPQAFSIFRYALDKGDDWKELLVEDWESGDYGTFTEGHMMDAIRDNLGPDWLAGFDIQERVSNGLDFHLYWESVIEEWPSEFEAEGVLSKLVIELNGDTNRWWDEWLSRSDEYSKEQALKNQTTTSP